MDKVKEGEQLSAIFITTTSLIFQTHALKLIAKLIKVVITILIAVVVIIKAIIIVKVIITSIVVKRIANNE